MSIINKQQTSFEKTKQLDKNGNEFWKARSLAKLLEYSDFRNFLRVIDKAKESCRNSKNKITDHFGDINEMVTIGSDSLREIKSYALSRYACYLIVQNADPRKPLVAIGQTYFAIQTRRQELQDSQEFTQLKEDEKRLFLRNELKQHNKQLVETAQLAGVSTNLDFAIFQNHGYKGLYGGLDAKGIKANKNLKKSHQILDYMGSTELAANLFRATQAEEKLKKDQTKTKEQANSTHFEVGKKVRKAIQDIGGTLPEKLPTPTKSVKKIQQEKNKLNSQSKSTK